MGLPVDNRAVAFAAKLDFVVFAPAQFRGMRKGAPGFYLGVQLRGGRNGQAQAEDQDQ